MGRSRQAGCRRSAPDRDACAARTPPGTSPDASPQDVHRVDLFDAGMADRPVAGFAHDRLGKNAAPTFSRQLLRNRSMPRGSTGRSRITPAPSPARARGRAHLIDAGDDRAPARAPPPPAHSPARSCLDGWAKWRPPQGSRPRPHGPRPENRPPGPGVSTPCQTPAQVHAHARRHQKGDRRP